MSKVWRQTFGVWPEDRERDERYQRLMQVRPGCCWLHGPGRKQVEHTRMLTSQLTPQADVGHVAELAS